MLEGLDATTLAPLILALSMFVGSLTFGAKLIFPEVVKLIVAIRESFQARETAKLEAQKAATAAAEASRADAEARLASEENTGRFLTGHTADRKQVEQLVADLKSELGLRDARIGKLESEVRELRASRDALFTELARQKKSRESGGAYPAVNPNTKE